MLPSPTNVRSRLRRIVFVAYEGMVLLDLAGPLEAFNIAAKFVAGKEGPVPYECTVVSARGGPVLTSAGVSVDTEPAKALDKAPIDTLIVPGATLVDDVTRDQAVVQWVRRKAADCRRVCSVCSGTFLLAEARLLDGLRATTHWLQCGLLSKRYPSVAVEPDAIFVRDGSMWTSAGVATGIDLGLALIEEDLGHKAAVAVARVLVVYLKRSGGQSQYSAILAGQAESDDDDFARLELWIGEHLTEDLGVEALAEKAHMSPRHFARVYVARRGLTPAKAVEAIRLDAARRLLESSQTRIKTVARQCGYRTEERMRVTFIRNLGISPRDFRERFASARFASEGDRRRGRGTKISHDLNVFAGTRR